MFIWSWIKELKVGSLIFVALFVSGCVAPLTSKDDVANLSGGEGVVLGSIIIKADESKEKDLPTAFIANNRTTESDMKVVLRKNELLSVRYTLPASANQPMPFIKKLPAGNYKLDTIQIKTSGLVSMDLSANLNILFDVKPGQVTYIGNVEIYLPPRVFPDAKFPIKIRDEQAATVSILSQQNSIDSGAVVKSLAVVKK